MSSGKGAFLLLPTKILAYGNMNISVKVNNNNPEMPVKCRLPRYIFLQFIKPSGIIVIIDNRSCTYAEA